MKNVDILIKQYNVDVNLLGRPGVKGDTGETGSPGTTDYNQLQNKPDLSLFLEATNLIAGTNVDLEVDGNNVTINSLGGAGQTFENIGTGQGIYKGLNIDTVLLRSLNNLSNLLSITLSEDLNTINFDLNQDNLSLTQSQIIGLSNTINSINTSISTINSEITTIQTDVSANTTDITNLKNIVTSINNEIDSINSSISTINSEITTIQTNVAKNTTDITTNSNAISNINSEIDSINNNVSTINSEITTIQTNVAKNTTDITTNSNAISNINSEIDSINNNVSTINSEITTIQTNVAKNTTDITTNASAISNIDSELVQLSSTINSLLDSINALNKLNILTTKGDLLVYDGTNYQRLAVGTDGQTLTSDSTKNYGLSWQTTTSSVDTIENKNVRYAIAKGNGFTTNSNGWVTLGTTGNSSNGPISVQLSYPATNTEYYATPRNSYQVADNPTSTSTVSYVTFNPADFAIGTAKKGGMKHIFEFGIESKNDPLQKVIVGLCSTFVGVPDLSSGVVNASNIIGLGWDAGDANISFFVNNNAGTTADKFPVSAFTGNLVASDYAARQTFTRFSFSFEIQPGGSTISVTFTNLETGNTATQVVTPTKMPSYDTFFKPMWLMCCGTANLNQMDIISAMRWYGKTSY